METLKKEKVGSYYIFDVPAFLKSLRKAGLFVNGGGSLMQDATSSRALYFYLFTLWAARRFGCRVVMYGCGIGPISRPLNRKIAGRILNRTADIITLRDSVSLELLNDMGVTRPEIVLAADPAVNLAYADEAQVRRAFASEGIPANLRMIGFCLRAWETFTRPEEVAKAAKYAWLMHGLTPVFLPIEMPKDVPVGESVAVMLDIPHYVCRNAHPVEDMIGMLGSMDLVLGMRLHSLIFATAGGAPVVGISYDVKVDSFIKDIGSSACVALKDLNAEDLCRHIDAVVAARRVGTDPDVRERQRERAENPLPVHIELRFGADTQAKRDEPPDGRRHFVRRSDCHLDCSAARSCGERQAVGLSKRRPSRKGRCDGLCLQAGASVLQ